MKRVLLGSLCCVVLGSAAHAQMAVDSLVADVNAAKQLINEAKQYALQYQQYLTEAQQLVQLGNTFDAFVRNPSLGTAMGIMNMTGLSNDLPINPAALMGLTSGYSMSLSGLTAKLGALNALATTAYDQNHVYTCTDASWACTQQRQRGYGLAGAMGIAQTAYQNIVAHQPVVQALRAQAATATTPAERENLAVALQAEQVWNENMMAELNAARMQAGLDQASLAQQDDERLSQSLEATIAKIP